MAATCGSLSADQPIVVCAKSHKRDRKCDLRDGSYVSPRKSERLVYPRASERLECPHVGAHPSSNLSQCVCAESHKREHARERELRAKIVNCVRVIIMCER